MIPMKYKRCCTHRLPHLCSTTMMHIEPPHSMSAGGGDDESAAAPTGAIKQAQLQVLDELLIENAGKKGSQAKPVCISSSHLKAAQSIAVFRFFVVCLQEIYYRLESALDAATVPGLAPGSSDIFSAAAYLSQGARHAWRLFYISVC